ncbi:MAG: hypothetical protein QNJ46_31150 [Leptolyngbyaceae cyanobacterium MO_188.B28]|nr:hypothetical protein [Leptolyngbyaceae cyanobacterium MO_188.B28]
MVKGGWVDGWMGGWVVRRAKLGFVSGVKVIIPKDWSRHQVLSVAIYGSNDVGEMHTGR